MALFTVIDQNNFVLFAAKNYRNRQCQEVDEFYEDLNEFKYVKKLINRFIKETNTVDKEKLFRLILNHVIIIYNVFEIGAATRMILFKMNREQLEVLKPILIFLNYISEKDLISVSLNKNIIDYCRKLKHE